MNTNERECLKYKKRIVIKIGSSSLTHKYTGMLNLGKVEKLIRVVTDLHNQGMEIILVSSGAIAVGRKTMGHIGRPSSTSEKQALAAIGQARLMTTYQKIFAEYNQIAAQILITKNIMLNETSRRNARNTFDELLKMGAIPIVNENDTISTNEIEMVDTFGDNDRLSSIVAAIVGADLLIMLSDIDGMYSDDPNTNPDAKFIEVVNKITDSFAEMGKSSSASNVGTGGMSAKIAAARIATDSGADMVITNGNDIDNIYKILDGENVGTLFKSHKNENFDLIKHILEKLTGDSMITQKEIDRINELYHKQKGEGLTPEEKEEQAKLRGEYIAAIRKNLRGSLNNISIQNEDGTITDLGKKYGDKEKPTS